MEKHIIDLDAWLQLPAGQYVKRWEENLFDQLTPDIFGYHALQVGLPQIDALRASRMPHRWIAQEEAGRSFGNPRVAVLHDFAEFPFASQSLDLVVLPHVLEFAEEPHQILREVERILIPEGRVIPENIINKPPSAELRPNQTDQDSLPPYDILDAILDDYVVHGKPLADILAAGHDEATVRRVYRMLTRAGYKRRQAAPGVKITHLAFGRDYRYPITNGFDG